MLHPLLSYYGQPPAPGRPRILVIGQEPDTDVRMGTHAGPYDLAAGSRTTFWTWSHKVIGRASGFGEYLRARAVERGSSPIVYSDASPASYAVGDPSAPRPIVSEVELAEHARHLLALTEARSCPVIIVSGRKSQWAAFYDVAEDGFRRLGATVVRVPFFGRSSTGARLLQPLQEPDVAEALRSCVETWASAEGLPFPDDWSKPYPKAVWDAFSADLEAEAVEYERDLRAHFDIPRRSAEDE
jgi:hypothetical protein